MSAIEINSTADVARIHTLAEGHSIDRPAAAEKAAWQRIIPFAADSPERIPEDLLPGPIGDMARAVAAWTETPIEMATMTGLGVVAASVAAKFRVFPSLDYSEPLQLYVATALPSGNRKTAVITEMAAPLRAAESQLVNEMAPTRRRLQSERKTLEVRIEKLRRKAAAAPDPGALTNEIAKLDAELPIVPPSPRLWTQDVTPERLGAMMAENGERMAVISDEGGIFDILAGRYSKTGAPNLDLFLQGHSGSPVRVDRGSRDPVVLNAPALTLILTPQPHVLRSLSEQKAFRGRGLLARFLFLMPPSSVGRRTHKTVPVPAYIRDAFSRCLSSLLAIPWAQDSEPPNIRFSRPAASAWEEFRNIVEHQMAEDGPLHELQDWGSKLPGAVARIAAVLHCSLYAGGSIPSEIDEETMNVAVQLGTVLVSHAVVAFRTIQKSEKIEHAERLLAWILRHGRSEFSVRDMFRAHQSRFEEVASMMPIVALLQDHGYVRSIVQEPKRGLPSDQYEVNPATFDRASVGAIDEFPSGENQ